MKQYVLGFAFNEAKDRVVLINKLKPEWQKGKLNGIGGKIENGEMPGEAMEREFLEETGVNLTCWTLFGKMLEQFEFDVYLYAAAHDVIMNCRSTSESEGGIVIHGVNPLDGRVIDNVKWLVPMALDHLNKPNFISTTEYNN